MIQNSKWLKKNKSVFKDNANKELDIKLSPELEINSDGIGVVNGSIDESKMSIAHLERVSTIEHDISVERSEREQDVINLEAALETESNQRKSELASLTKVVADNKQTVETRFALVDHQISNLTTDLNKAQSDILTQGESLTNTIKETEAKLNSNISSLESQHLADVTNINASIKETTDKLTSDFETGYSSLLAKLDTETSERKNDVVSLSSDLQETSDVLNSKISTETSNRKAAITSLQNYVDSKDVQINSAISAEVQNRKNAISTVEMSLEQEASDRQQAVSNEAKARENGDLEVKALLNEAKALLQGNIDEEASARLADIAVATARLDVIQGTGDGSIKKAVADLVAGAPEMLDTLNELATAISEGGSVTDAITQAVADAKEELKGTASTLGDSLGELETRIEGLSGNVDATIQGLEKAVMETVNFNEESYNLNGGIVLTHKPVGFLTGTPIVVDIEGCPTLTHGAGKDFELKGQKVTFSSTILSLLDDEQITFKYNAVK